MLVELKPRSYQATLYMQAGTRLSQTTTGEGGTPTPTEQTGKCLLATYSNCIMCMHPVPNNILPLVSLSCSWYDLRRGHENIYQLRQVHWWGILRGYGRWWHARGVRQLRRGLHGGDGLCRRLPHLQARGEPGEYRLEPREKQDGRPVPTATQLLMSVQGRKRGMPVISPILGEHTCQTS